MTAFYKHDEIPAQKFTLLCSWGDDDCVSFIQYERGVGEKDQANEYEDLYFNVHVHPMTPSRRLKAMWGVLWYGEYENFGVMTGRVGIRSLIDYLENVLRYWDKFEVEDKEKGVMSVIDCVEPLK